MPTKYIATEWDRGERVQTFVIPIPDVGEQDFYRHTVSLGAFGNRELKRCFGPHSSLPASRGRRFTVQSLEEHEADVKRLANSPHIPHVKPYLEALAALPKTEVSNLGEFYTAIRYDPKTNKYE